MSDSADSLLIQAQRLSAIARAKRENESDARAEGQVATALTKLNGQLGVLEGAVRSYQTLRAAEIPIASPPDLKGPAVALQTQVVKLGRPSAQFLTKRSGDLARNITDLTTAADEAWSTWADGQIAALQGDAITGHGPRVAEILELIKDLRSQSKAKFTIANFHLFKLALARVRDLIDELLNPTDREKILARIATGGVTLADLTDGEIADLRADPAIASVIRLYLQ